MKNEFVAKENHIEMILTAKGKTFTCLIDKDDYEKVANFKYKWGILSNCADGYWYVRAVVPKGDKRTTLLLHRFLTNCGDNLVVDHINHNVYDNRKSNLRIVTQFENMQNFNQNIKNQSGGVRGVSYDKKHKKWRVRRVYNNRMIDFGYLKTFDDAATFKRLMEVMFFG